MAQLAERHRQRLDEAAGRGSRSLRTFVELWGIAVRAGRGERDPRFDRFVADDFESLPWDSVPSRRAGMAGAAAAGLRDKRSAAVLEAILEPYHDQLLIRRLAALCSKPPTACAGTC